MLDTGLGPGGISAHQVSFLLNILIAVVANE